MGKVVGALKRGGGSNALSAQLSTRCSGGRRNSDNNSFGDTPHACVLIIFANDTDGGNGLHGQRQWI